MAWWLYMSLPLTDLHCQTFPLNLYPTELDWIYSQFSLAVPHASARGGRNQPESILHLTHLFANKHPPRTVMQHSNNPYEAIAWCPHLDKDLQDKFEKLYEGVRAMRDNVSGLFDAIYLASVRVPNSTRNSFVDEFKMWIETMPKEGNCLIPRILSARMALQAYAVTRSSFEEVPLRARYWLEGLLNTPHFRLLLSFVEFEMSCPHHPGAENGTQGLHQWWINSEDGGLQSLTFRSGDLQQLITDCQSKFITFSNKWASLKESDVSLKEHHPSIPFADIRKLMEGVLQKYELQRPATGPCGSRISNPASASFEGSGTSSVHTTVASIDNRSATGSSTPLPPDSSMSLPSSTAGSDASGLLGSWNKGR